MTRQYNHQLRLDRAAHHLQHFEDEALRWLGSNPYSISRELDAEHDKYLLKVHILKPPPGQLGVIIGDVLHNLRSALDNLAYELAIAHTGDPLPNDIAEYSEFPIFKKPMTDKQREQKIGGTHPDAQTLINMLQPYQQGDKFNRHPLWALRQLSNIDKHRLPHLTLIRPSGISVSGAGGPLQDRGFELEWGPMENDAVIARYSRFDESGAEVNVQFHHSFEVGFGPVPGVPPMGCSAHWFLKWLWEHIAWNVIPSLYRFLT